MLCPKPELAADVGLRLRYAKKEDIALINQCNIDNLPENYSNYFYLSQLTQWPELSLIAECEQTNELMGYALGRVEMAPFENALDNNNMLYEKTPHLGHIASIAVNDKFRGHGVARKMMLQLHKSFVRDYDVDNVSLYCRVSLHLFPDLMPFFLPKYC